MTHKPATLKQLEQYTVTMDDRLTDNYCQLSIFVTEIFEKLALQEKIIETLLKKPENLDVLQHLDAVKSKIQEKYS